MKITTFGIGLAALAIAVPVQLSAATAISGSMNIRVDALLPTGTKTSTASDSYIGAPQAMVVFAVATATNGLTSGLVTAIAQGQSSGTANAGSVHFANYGWTFGAPDEADAGQGANLNQGGPDWSYSFLADKDGALTIDYDVFLTDGTNGFGLQGWSIIWSGSGGNLAPPGTFNDPTASGSFVRSLTAGQSYTVALYNNANIFYGESVPAGAPIRMAGNFVYNITETAVPEPATWAMMVVGFGLVGAMRRRSVTLLPA